LLESDRRYFEMAAVVHPLSHGELAWMPGLTELAASCVIQRVEEPIGPDWLDEAESALAQRHVRLARVYLEQVQPAGDSLLQQRGYVQRGEIGFLAPQGHPRPHRNARLCAVADDADWKQKLRFHERAMEGPDGYTNSADLWVEMERRKCETGQMRCFLVRRNRDVVAAVGAILEQGLVRLKNIVVAPESRRSGLGIATVHLLWTMAEETHGCRLGVFGVEGGQGGRLYQRAGLYQVTSQYEWSRLLTG
jgi:hypothetical protein